MRIKSFLALLLLVSTGLPTFAQDKDPDSYKEERLPFGYVRSMDAFASGFHPTASSLLMQAEWENRYGHHDKAIHLCQRALEIDPEDMDVHKAYAESLEKKLSKQKGDEKDLNLFLAAVREWLIVLRGERGEEKGLTRKDGRGIPGMTWLYRDEDRAIPAKNHIIALCGRSPGYKESDQKFMHDMYVRASEMVNARIVSKSKKASSAVASSVVEDEEVSGKVVSGSAEPEEKPSPTKKARSKKTAEHTSMVLH